MIRIEKHFGTIEISQDYFRYLIGNAVSDCFGVTAMIRSGARQNLRSVFTRRSFTDDGVLVRSEGNKLVIDLHISVMHGMNIPEIVKSIVNKVRFTIEDATGLLVKKVNVFVDNIVVE